MEINVKDSGLRTNSMDMGMKPGQMVLSILVTMRWVKSKVKDFLHGMMGVYTIENSKIIIFKVKVYIPGQMAENISEIGKIIKWKDQESSLG